MAQSLKIKLILEKKVTSIYTQFKYFKTLRKNKTFAYYQNGAANILFIHISKTVKQLAENFF